MFFEIATISPSHGSNSHGSMLRSLRPYYIGARITKTWFFQNEIAWVWMNKLISLSLLFCNIVLSFCTLWIQRMYKIPQFFLYCQGFVKRIISDGLVHDFYVGWIISFFLHFSRSFSKSRAQSRIASKKTWALSSFTFWALFNSKCLGA